MAQPRKAPGPNARRSNAASRKRRITTRDSRHRYRALLFHQVAPWAETPSFRAGRDQPAVTACALRCLPWRSEVYSLRWSALRRRAERRARALGVRFNGRRRGDAAPATRSVCARVDEGGHGRARSRGAPTPIELTHSLLRERPDQRWLLNHWRIVLLASPVNSELHWWPGSGPASPLNSSKSVNSSWTELTV
jgi:hypothetical protein